jgi:uncharacterized membrane protein YkoI
MLRSKFIPATMAAVIALGAGADSAATGEHENAGEIAAALAAKVSPAQAIATAEQQTGGRAVKIDVEGKNDTHFYEIKTISGEKLAAVLVDSATGKIVSTEARIFDEEDRMELAGLDSSPTTLAAAIGTAEQQVGGKAVEAGYENENGQMLFEVEVAKDKTVHKVEIDAATGKVVKVANGEDGEHERD